MDHWIFTWLIGFASVVASDSTSTSTRPPPVKDPKYFLDKHTDGKTRA
jgi:hypothetical protein